MTLIDAHCHLSQLSPDDLTGVIDRAKAAGVATLVAIGAGYGFEDNQKTLAIALAHDNIFCALAMHPHDAKDVTDENFATLKNMILSSPKVRAVGEIGLDYHYMHSPKDVQLDALKRFIALAREVKKPLVIHDRDCGDACVDMLNADGAREVGGMVHCFTGSLDLAKKYLDLGFIVSFTGIITFKKSHALREVVKYVPLNRLTIETDSPFLAPEPFRGKVNEPAYVQYVAHAVAAIKQISFEEVARVTTENAQRLFGIN